MFFYKQSKFRKQAGYACGKILFRLKICLHYAFQAQNMLALCLFIKNFVGCML